MHLTAADATGSTPRRLLTLRPGKALAVTEITFACVDGPAVAALAEHARNAGASVREIPADEDGQAGFSFADLEGLRLAVRPGSLPLGRTLPPSAVRPRRIGHINLKVADAPRGARLIQDTLGLQLSEQIGEQFYFLRTGAEHHNLGLRGGADVATVHHVAFEIESWATFKTVCDRLAEQGSGVEFGPGRHAPGHNLFVYVVEPTSGLRLELFAEMDRVDDGVQPKMWAAADRPRTVNRWGPQPPDSFLK